MDQVAFIIGETFIYWNSIILILAVVTAVCTFLAFYLLRYGNGIRAALLIPLAAVLSILLARLIHWYCRADAYESLKTAMTDFTGGGYALMGVFAGCALAASLLRLIGVIKNLPRTFDCMTLAGAAGISIGRLACLFTSADRGMLIEGITSLPLVYPVNNAVTGETEYRLATFMLQSIITGGIFVALAVFYMAEERKYRRRKMKGGDTALLFLSAYCAAQAVLDSTRYDSLFLRSNGFISVVQILSAVAMVSVIVVFSVRMVKNTGFKGWNVLLWVLAVAFLGGAGFMEYWVQRHGHQALFSYSIMSFCLVGIVILTCVIRGLAMSGKQKPAPVQSKN
ncbi:MAG: prolipoprotein diacylglyceryl transferase [Oscillospiraceae bacterium]|nr:prolipoprotein diacylglyceryl transferase [Oscillospiraceae bacterium]